MSSPLAIGAVSAVLRNLLDDGLIQAGAALGTTVNVSAVAPDTIDLDDANASPRLNIFMHRVSPNTGWSNHALPSRNAANGERLTNAPLALNLHYLLTAYGSSDCQAEILLGYAMHLLHERPVLDRAAVRRALDPSPIDVSMLPPAFQALAASDLADQVEVIKVTPEMMSGDDMSRLWAAIQSHYRPSSAYQASVVLIEGKKPGVNPLPVLSRGGRDATTQRERGVFVTPDLLPPFPTLLSLTTPATQSVVRLGDQVKVTGVRLAGSGHRIRLSHRLLAVPFEFAPDSVGDDGRTIIFTLPTAAVVDLAAGQMVLTVRLTVSGEASPRETNALPLILAPQPDIAGATVTRIGVPPTIRVELNAAPQVGPQQNASLVLGTLEAVAEPRANAAAPLVFRFANSLAAGTYRARLRVDGADSVLIDHSGPSPVFDPLMQLTVPA
jgi:Pvc16 N-terminal domain